MEALYASIVSLQEVDKLDTFAVHQLADGDLATEVTHKYVVVSLIVIYCRAEQDEKYYLHKMLSLELDCIEHNLPGSVAKVSSEPTSRASAMELEVFVFGTAEEPLFGVWVVNAGDPLSVSMVVLDVVEPVAILWELKIIL